MNRVKVRDGRDGLDVFWVRPDQIPSPTMPYTANHVPFSRDWCAKRLPPSRRPAAARLLCSPPAENGRKHVEEHDEDDNHDADEDNDGFDDDFDGEEEIDGKKYRTLHLHC